VQLIRFALFASVLLFAAIPELFRVEKHSPSEVVFYVVVFVVLWMAISIFKIRSVLILRAETLLASNPSDAVALRRWQAGYVATYAVFEAIGLYGLVLRYLGFALTRVLPFYIAAVALILAYGPRRTQSMR